MNVGYAGGCGCSKDLPRLGKTMRVLEKTMRVLDKTHSLLGNELFELDDADGCILTQNAADLLTFQKKK